MDESDKLLLESKRRLYAKHLDACVTLVRDAIRGAFLLNGAAVTAVLTTQDINKFSSSVWCFALGASLAVVTSVVAYLSQRCVADSWEHVIQGTPKPFKHERLVMGCALLLLVCSFVLFGGGLLLAARGI